MQFAEIGVPLAAFVGNSTWFIVLLIVHVAGAIILLGPTYAFSILGPAAEKAGPNGGVAIMEAMVKIERKMVTPWYFVTQPLSGVLLIFNRGLNNDFFSGHNLWLIGALVLYIITGVIAYGVNTPAMERMIHKAKAGEMDAEFGTLSKKVSALGPVLALLGAAIILLMIWKPGSGCGDLFRC